MPNTAFCPMRSSCKEQRRSVKKILDFCLFLWVPKTFPVFVFLSKALHIQWCGKPKAIIWAMLLTGFYKCIQKYLHYTCPTPNLSLSLLYMILLNAICASNLMWTGDFQFLVDFCPLPQEGSSRQCILGALKQNLFSSKPMFFTVLPWQNFVM